MIVWNTVLLRCADPTSTVLRVAVHRRPPKTALSSYAAPPRPDLKPQRADQHIHMLLSLSNWISTS